MNPLGSTAMLLQGSIEIEMLEMLRVKVTLKRSKVADVLQHGTKNNNSKKIKPTQAHDHCPL